MQVLSILIMTHAVLHNRLNSFTLMCRMVTVSSLGRIGSSLGRCCWSWSGFSASVVPQIQEKVKMLLLQSSFYCFSFSFDYDIHQSIILSDCCWFWHCCVLRKRQKPPRISPQILSTEQIFRFSAIQFD